MTSESGDICLQSWMKLTLFTFHLTFGRFPQNAHFNTNSLANISVQGYPISALFVLIDRTISQLTMKSVVTSSGTHFFVSLLCFLDVLIFVKLTPKMRNLKLKVQNKKIEEKKVYQT